MMLRIPSRRPKFSGPQESWRPSSSKCRSPASRVPPSRLSKVMDYLILNDIPTPWREPVFERVYQRLHDAVRVVYFKGNEKRRLWSYRMGSHPKTVLPCLTLTIRQ